MTQKTFRFTKSLLMILSTTFAIALVIFLEVTNKGMILERVIYG